MTDFGSPAGTLRRGETLHTVLVANRGEIAVRVIRTLRRMGIRSVAVYSDADAHARHVHEADVAVRVGPAEARKSYLSIPDIVRAAESTGAQAVHPGYGFLSENPAFARACREAGLVFVGPPPEAIETMGDKITAKATVSAAGVPVVPGIAGTPEELLDRAAAEVGCPMLLKPSAGGGGKGMRVVHEAGELAEAIASAQREARAAFGDDSLLAERFVSTPRHIEVQVLADAHGTTVHLGERECSLQRRHQKIIEEAPSALLDADTRERMGAAAVEAVRAVGYVGAGTVEFITSGDAPGGSGDGGAGEFFFMETNTRLQVEHPVTELVTGIDLVEWQLRVAAGERLPFTSADIAMTGHAVEARIYAEDPARGFVPTGGTVLAVAEPQGTGVRVDSGIDAGTVVGSDYDPMLAKVIATGPDRTTALHRLDRALADTAVLGVGTNVPFLRGLLAIPEVQSGELDTGLVERVLDEVTAPATREAPAEFFAAAALDRLLQLWPAGGVVDPWTIPTGWRLGGAGGTTFLLRSGEIEAEVHVRGEPADALVRVGDGEAVVARAFWNGWRADEPGILELRYAGQVQRYRRALGPEGRLWLAREGRCVPFDDRPRLAVAHAGGPEAGPVSSPMPGTVIAVKTELGAPVTAGEALMIVEAMKMEHTITAPVDGVVSELHVTAGQQVALDEPLALVTPDGEAGGDIPGET
ncbi:biotin carboxylase N-terminal domain-containing protein [Haloechinothrix sp. LS1_15]|uniref:acetyl/propionyl/methylcrotonyl-CoA carboxylase subunit alpha n=1 Tax=Haloechinothrix sp. LS1_15 TaxID=2652248 RepID=UPI0029460462|nr:biotin carboxylase N-terminal domain-containing protein [Haloechinothrix sp. LS1_15]MDV6011706.1 acetyl/propionyl-CoA carboxylase subunit alpha [Haloechinothrix sp. LS1_15]